MKRRWIGALALLALSWSDVQGQGVCYGDAGCRPEPDPAPWRRDVRYTAINAALGALTVGAASLLRGRRPELRPVLLGAAGGAVVFGGKRIAGEPATGTGFVGRQVAALGGAMIRNSAAGRPPLSSFTVPVGPFRLETAPGDSTTLRVNLASLIAAGFFLLEGEGSRFDLGATLSSGALVLVGREVGLVGRHAAGVVHLPGRQDLYDEGLVLRHESIHVIQSDQAFAMLSDPVESWIRGLHPVARRWGRHVHLGLEAVIAAALNGLVQYDDRPWEIEAYRLTGEWN